MLKSKKKPSATIQDRRQASPVTKQKTEQSTIKPGSASFLDKIGDNKKKIAGRTKLAETEKIILGGFEKAKEMDKKNISNMSTYRIKAMMNPDTFPKTTKQKLPDKAPIPTAKPKKKKS